MQIWEGLFAYNFSDPDLAMYPVLATSFGTWTSDNLNFTVGLQQGVTFHSGYAFNASAVKFSFDRLNFLCNFTGDQGALDTVYGESIIAVLYSWPDGTAVINETIVVDEYTVKFVLNRVFGVFLPLLTFSASDIFDPSITPAEDYICEGMSGATAETISGTGPWVFQYYISGIETKFLRNDNYWRTPAQVESLVFAVIQDADARNTALLSHDINLLDAPNPGYYQTMRDDPTITLYAAGPGTITSYLGFNNLMINHTWRSAMQYAVDYDYIIDELREGEAVRLKSPIPLGIQFANWSFDVPTLDLTVARSYMTSMGYGVGFTTDDEWVAVAEGSSPFRTVNFTYNIKINSDMILGCY
jgi:ABC-type transport system substrate-binding protein